MPANDYTAAVSGGLKLKGVNSSSKVSKSHKKKRPKTPQPESCVNARAEKFKDGAINDSKDAEDEQDEGTIDRSNHSFEEGEATPPPQVGKTEAELRHEEHRRKRVCYSYLLLLSSFCMGILANSDASARRAPEARRH